MTFLITITFIILTLIFLVLVYNAIMNILVNKENNTKWRRFVKDDE